MDTPDFPDQIFLKLEANDTPYFVHYETAAEIAVPDSVVEVGVYKLVGTAHIKAPVAVAGPGPTERAGNATA